MLDWSQIKLVFLDLDGTLLDLSFDNYFWQQYVPSVWAEKNSISFAEASAYIHSLTLKYRGQLCWYCLDFWGEQLSLDLHDMKIQVRDQIQWRAGSLEFLDWLAARSIELFLVTNAHPKTLSVKFDQIPMKHYFSKIISSHHFSAPKESQEFWQRFVQEHPFDPKTTAFIDDTEAVLKSASLFGIAHLLSIAKPDSRDHKERQSQFPMVHRWDQLMGPN